MGTRGVIGFTADGKDRFADMGKTVSRGLTDVYYPVALVAEYPFDAIPEDWQKVFESEEEAA